MIKQDIVHHVVERTGLPRTKAEAAVDTVFEGLKRIPGGWRGASSLRGFSVVQRPRSSARHRRSVTHVRGLEVQHRSRQSRAFQARQELHSLESGTNQLQRRQPNFPGCLQANDRRELRSLRDDGPAF